MSMSKQKMGSYSHIGLAFLFFCCFYVVKLRLLPFTLPVVFFLYFFLTRFSAKLIGGFSTLKSVSNVSFLLLFMQLLLILSLLLSSSLSGATDMSLIKGQVVLLLFFCVTHFLVSKIPRSSSFIDLMQAFSLIVTIQSVAIIVSFLVPGIRDFIADISATGFSDLSGGSWRLSGLSGLGGSTLSLVQGIGLFTSFYLLMVGSKIATTLISVPLILISIMFTGKSGFLAIPLFFVFLLVYSLVSWRLNRKLTRAFIFLTLGTPIFLVLFYFVYSSFFYQETVWGGDALYGSYRRATQEYANIFAGEGSRTFNYVTSEFTLPSSFTVMLLGDLDTWSLNRYSDVLINDNGYLRILWGYGLIGMVLLYMVVLIMMVASVAKLREFSDRLFLILLYIWLLVMNIKEPYLIMPCIFFLVATIYFVLNGRWNSPEFRRYS